MALGRHPKVLIGWAVVTTAALTAFYFSRQSINKKRYNLMIQDRQRKKEEAAKSD